MATKQEEQKIGLVLEGGSMRGLFTAGVLDTFMDENIKIDGIVGTSAGAVFGPNYFSGQKGRALRYNKRFCKNRRYISFWSFLLTGNMINRQFAFYDVTTRYDVFDNETFMQNNTGFYATVTNTETGKPEYLAVQDVLKEMEVLRATSALPFVSKMVNINGAKYLDGGISDSIPVLACKKMGYNKIIVVLTRPVAYRKKPLGKKTSTLVRLRYRKHPHFVQTMINRHQMYNQTLDLIQELEEKGEIFVIRPSEAIKTHTVERNAQRLQAAYDLGVAECKKSLASLKSYLHA